MTLSEADEELLELAALQVPWYMVCGEFHRRYGSPGVLAHRLFELERAGLLIVGGSAPDGAPLTPDVLEADALAHGCYAELETSREPLWEIVASEQGMDRIRHRLEPE